MGHRRRGGNGEKCGEAKDQKVGVGGDRRAECEKTCGNLKQSQLGEEPTEREK